MAREGSDKYFNKQAQNNDKATNTPINDGTHKYNRGANRTACAGLIFMCNESTKLDCFKYRVLGLSEKKKNQMDMITKGMCLFLFDVNSKMLYGIYTASSRGAFMLEPDAFGGNYPWQVKFHIEKDCLPLGENVFKAAIEDNYFSTRKFKTELNAEQVQKLVSLFSPLPGGPVQHPRPHCVTPFTNPASYCVESAPLLRLNHEHTYPLDKSAMIEKCMHCYHAPNGKHGFVPRTLTCEANRADGFMQCALPKLNHEPTRPLNDVAMANTCMHGYHAPAAKHGFLPSTSTCEAHKADGFIQNDPLPRLNHDLTHPQANDAIVTKKCVHGYQAKHNFLPPTLTEATNNPDVLMQNALRKLNHEPKYPLNMAEKCMHNYHTPTAKHEHKCEAAGSHQQCGVERDAYMSQVIGSSPIHRDNHAGPLSSLLYALGATSELQNSAPNQIRTGAQLYPGNLAAYVNSSAVLQGYLMPNTVHGTLLERTLHEGEPMGVSSSLSSHAKIAPKGPGVLNAFPGCDSTASLHKRPHQDTYTCALIGAARSVFDTNGERPVKCMHHEVLRRPIEDTFAGAVDGVPPNCYGASLLHGGIFELSHGNEVLPTSRNYIGCGW